MSQVEKRMRAIWQFEVSVQDHFEVEMPVGAEVLSVMTQPSPYHDYADTVQMWALCDPAALKETKRFCVIGTGHPVDLVGLGRFIGTFQLAGGTFVGHLFELL